MSSAPWSHERTLDGAPGQPLTFWARRLPKGAVLRLSPTALFWIAGLIAYGGAAFHFAHGHFLNQMPRDVWQHLAVLRELIAHPFHPLNPFLPTADGSRHFHPYWVGIALLARVVGWNEWQAIAFAGFVTAGVLLSGIYAFGRAFYQDERGPLALLAAMVFGWFIAISHTGYHSMDTLIEGIAYPAVMLIGMSFLLWALVIRALERPKLIGWIVPLSALMFAVHQLGAVIGFIVASSLIALWPESTFKRRAAAAAALGVGILASTAWPYFNPIVVVLRPGNSTWLGGLPFYSPPYLVSAFIPQIVGLAGFRTERFKRRSLPILAAFIAFAAIFAIGPLGLLIATRFVMPAVLMLHIGLGALLLTIASNWGQYTDRRRLTLFGVGIACVSAYGTLTAMHLQGEARVAQREGNAQLAARELTADIPDMQPIAALDIAVWPIVSTGQRALSEPWPEPGIPDLADRQRRDDALFDPSLSREQRVQLARASGVRTLILTRAALARREIPLRTIGELKGQSVQWKRVGTYYRFDLY